MGWFEEQVKRRRELDMKTFEESFKSLAGIRTNKQEGLSDQEIKENFAISQILSYFHFQMIDLPSGITKFYDKLNYALERYDIVYHEVDLDPSYDNEFGSVLLFFRIVDDIPVVLFPKGKDKYYYINYATGKKAIIEASLIHRLELKAYCFYRPLPNKKMSIKEYARYVRGSVRVFDIISVILISLIASGVGLLIPYLTKILTGDVVNSGNMNQLLLISIYVVASATGLLLVKAIQVFINSRILLKIEKATQKAAMMKVLSLPPSFFKKYNTGGLSARAASVSTLSSTIANGMFIFLSSVVISLSYLLQLISFAPVLILPVVGILVISTSFSILIAFISRNHSRKLFNSSFKESGVTYEMINGIQKIRLAGAEKRMFNKWTKAYSKTVSLRHNPPLIIRLSVAINLAITLLGNILIYYIAAKNNIDAGNYMAFVTSYGILSGAFASLTSFFNIMASVKPIYEMAKPILDAEVETKQDKITLDSIQGNIELKDVTFRYQEDGNNVIDHLSLKIKEGEFVAVVGETGCGKSTLVRLLLGFEQPLEGQILFDDINIDKVDLPSLRKNIGTVLQNGTLFHAEILSNILISCPALKEEDAWAAAEIADIANDIREMPMGMKTVISEGSGSISGGQKQRIMIARAIVHKPKVLIFDEATSALDNKTQSKITDSISKLNCTRIVIAHRLSTIRSADRIIMISGGKIIEEGNYDSLIAKQGKFAELVDRQRLD